MDSSGNIVTEPLAQPNPWSEQNAQSSLDSLHPNPWSEQNAQSSLDSVHLNPWSEQNAQSSLDSLHPNPWPHPDRPGNHFLSIYMCGFIDISGGGIELRDTTEECFE
jgi:hypothetical protein